MEIIVWILIAVIAVGALGTTLIVRDRRRRAAHAPDGSQFGDRANSEATAAALAAAANRRGF